jgi:RNA polymerase sigma-70 factor, ECF subfamily
VLEYVAVIESTSTGSQASEVAFEELVRAHARFVFKIAYSVLRNHHDAEDAVQETFLRVMRRSPEIHDVRDIRAWLARIAWRIAVDRRRRAPHSEDAGFADDLALLRSHTASAEQSAIGAQMLRVAERLIASLPPELRDPLTLSTVEELNSPEIAAVLGIPEATVRTRLFRARKVLKEKLAALLEGQPR